MEKPKITDKHRKLQALAGSWRGEETLYPSPLSAEGGTAIAKVAAHMGLGGFFLIMNYAQEREGAVIYRGHGIVGWSEPQRCYLMFWFDSTGLGLDDPPSKGTWSGDTLTFEDRTPMGFSRIRYALEGVHRYRFTMEFSEDGHEWQLAIDAEFQREGDMVVEPAGATAPPLI